MKKSNTNQREENLRLQKKRTEYYNNNLHKNKNEIATMMEEILNGDIYIAPLHESNESIGEMEHEVSIVEPSSSRRKIPGCVVCKGKLNCHSFQNLQKY